MQVRGEHHLEKARNTLQGMHPVLLSSTVNQYADCYITTKAVPYGARLFSNAWTTLDITCLVAGQTPSLKSLRDLYMVLYISKAKGAHRDALGGVVDEHLGHEIDALRLQRHVCAAVEDLVQVLHQRKKPFLEL